MISDIFFVRAPDTPYQDMFFTNWPRYTILRGKIMWANGQLIGKPREGRFLRRGKSMLAGYASLSTNEGGVNGTSVSRSLQEWEKDRRTVAGWLYG